LKNSTRNLDLRDAHGRRALRLHSPAPGIDHAKIAAAAGVRFSQTGAALPAAQNADVPDAGFPTKAAEEIVHLLELSRAGPFCLFTSYSQMNDLFERVRSRVSFPLLLQGTAPRSVLAERFKNNRGAVLFARRAFGRRDVRANSYPASSSTGYRLPCRATQSCGASRALQEDGRNPFAISGCRRRLALTSIWALDSNETDGCAGAAGYALQRCPMVKFSWSRCHDTEVTHELADVARFSTEGYTQALGAHRQVPSEGHI